MTRPIQLIMRGAYAAIYWYKAGGSRDPLRFFGALPWETQAGLFSTLNHYARHGHLGFARGHEEPWEFETPDTPSLVLYKFKRNPLIRFYAVNYERGGLREVVVVYGFKASKKKREDREDKRRAERAAVEYLGTT